MRYIWQHINTIIVTYDGSLPLAHFIRQYFKQYPILGSRDRKILSAMAYCWYRCSKVLAPGAKVNEQNIKRCLQLCNNALAANEKLFPAPDNEVPDSEININALFPYDVPLSDGMDKAEWLRSMLVQPDLFIRIRKDKGKVASLLNAQQIPFTFITDDCMALPNGAKIDGVLPEDTYVVQDASSQKTGSFFNPGKNEQWYDCCSGAGGKSLLLKDLEPGVRLTISDKRESIIHNLKQRFRVYDHQLPVAHVTDTGNTIELAKALGGKLFDAIICDAPCSGSGTWARTPEQLYFFNKNDFPNFPQLQSLIAVNVARYLKPGGKLIYITCSVFRQENEDVAATIVAETGLELVSSQLINGIGIRADSMYVAVLGRK
jgi:16S rRNA (cytosine967-C5)-methyltransferase